MSSHIEQSIIPVSFQAHRKLNFFDDFAKFAATDNLAKWIFQKKVILAHQIPNSEVGNQSYGHAQSRTYLKMGSIDDTHELLDQIEIEDRRLV